MFGIGMPELAVILVVGLIVLGPKRLPEVARALGKGLAEFRRVTGEVNKELDAARSMIEQEARDHDLARRKADQERARVAAEKAVLEKAAAEQLAAQSTPIAAAAPAPEPALVAPAAPAPAAMASTPPLAAIPSEAAPAAPVPVPAEGTVPAGSVASTPSTDEPGSKA
jgi:sec-independent protein translocase protein TatB